jgi:hypothetical protein
MTRQEERIAAATKHGVVPAAEKSAQIAEADPIAEFNAAVEEQMNRGLDRTQATKRVVHANQELHEAFIAAINRK